MPPGSPRTLMSFWTTLFILLMRFLMITEILAHCPNDSSVSNTQSLLLSAVTHTSPFLTTLILGISSIRYRLSSMPSTVSPIEFSVCSDDWRLRTDYNRCRKELFVIQPWWDFHNYCRCFTTYLYHLFRLFLFSQFPKVILRLVLSGNLCLNDLW